jgi:hypothetical protein
MSQPENQSRMANAKDKLDQTRDQARQSSQQLNQGDVSKALASSARTEQDLKKLSEDFRKSTSQRFAEDMRQMRQQARDLNDTEQKIAQQMQEETQSRKKSLSDSGAKKEIQQQMEQQQKRYQELLQNMKQVTEQAEASEPVLARQLYDTIRKSGQENLDKTLETSSRFLERNFMEQAAELEEKARKSIADLKGGVDRAAASVLGDEAEALRLAQRELDDLASRVERELASARAGFASTNRNLTNVVAAAVDRNGDRRAVAGNNGEQNSNQANSAGRTNQLAQAQSGQGPEGNNQNQRNSDGSPRSAEQANREPGQGEQQGQQASNQNGNNQRGQNQPGQGQGEGAEQPQNGQRGEGQTPGENQQQGGGQGGRAVAQNQNQNNGRNGSQNANPGQAGGARSGERNFFENWNGAGGGGIEGGGRYDGPLTGSQYGQWVDRLRDVEEMIDDPDLRNQVARVREEARTLRRQFGTDKKPPQWDLVQMKIVSPMRSLQSRLSEELARRQGTESLAPVDRDPVPSKFSELVNKYYEELGRGN